jgi:hypothetical protein
LSSSNQSALEAEKSLLFALAKIKIRAKLAAKEIAQRNAAGGWGLEMSVKLISNSFFSLSESMALSGASWCDYRRNRGVMEASVRLHWGQRSNGKNSIRQKKESQFSV